MPGALAFNRILPDRPKRGTVSDLRQQYPLNILIAYPYFDKASLPILERQPKGSVRLLVDSGAFTAHTLGKPIHHQAYLSFLKTLSVVGPYNAVQLDVIGNPEATYKNLMMAYDAGLEVMPVFTRGESLDRLEQFYRLSPYILLGGVAQGALNTNYVTWFEKHNKGRPVHWLGFTRVPFLKHYKPLSADSSSWMSCARYGRLDLYAGAGRFLTWTRAQSQKPPSPAIVKAIGRMGLTLSELHELSQGPAWRNVGLPGKARGLGQGDKVQGDGSAIFMAVLSHILLAMETEAQLKTRYYLACINAHQVELAIAARDFLIARNALRP